jgi:sigma-B regulation protein RsbQ
MTLSTVTRVVARNRVVVLGTEDRPVIMFAHGFGCDQNMWRRLVPAFMDDYRIVLFDHVGAGGSDLDAYDPQKYSTLDGYAADILQICDELDLHDVTLVGHSVASMMALTAAAAQPERFRRLVLVAPSPCYIDDSTDGYVGGFSSEDIEGLLDALDNNYFAWAAAMAPTVMGPQESPELAEELTDSFCRTDPAIARDFARLTFLSDSRHLLPRVHTPTLLLQCTDDALAPPEVGDYLHSHLGSSRLVRLEAIGHCPHVSDPDETAAAILGFLASTQ